MRRRQVEAMAKLDDIMGIGRTSPSKAAADIVADVLNNRADKAKPSSARRVHG
jgi:hypothetical protein